MKDLTSSKSILYSFLHKLFDYYDLFVFGNIFECFLFLFSSDLDENLQKAFHKYLEIRGIKPSTTNFLHEYMINKDSREYLVWLKKLKEFVEA